MYSNIDFISLGEFLDQEFGKANAALAARVDNMDAEQVAAAVVENVKWEMDIQWKALGYFSRQASFSACLPTGGTVKLSSNFLHIYRPKKGSADDFAFHPCLAPGTLYISTDNLDRIIRGFTKNKPSSGDLIIAARLQFMRSKIMPLNGASLQVSIRHRPKSLSVLTQAENEDRAEKDIVSEILRLSDKGMRRDDIKRILCPNLAVDSWRAIWKEASKMKPEIMRSGPKPRNSVRN